MAYAAVTGAASGIGAATARLLAARGMRVALLDVRSDATIDAPAGARYAERTRGFPVGRAATPEEVAAAIAYLSGPDAGSITGTDLDVDGGLSLS